MKRLFKVIGFLSLLVLVSLPMLTSQNVQAHTMENRVFFLHSSVEDGVLIRRTGCINVGGSCWSESTMVADCSTDGGQTWSGCEDNRTLAPEL